MRDCIRILGVDIDNINIEEAGEKTKELVEKSNKTCKMIVAPNVEFIMTAQKDEEFFNILKKADFATPTEEDAISRFKIYFFITGLLFKAILIQSLSPNDIFFSICIFCIA